MKFFIIKFSSPYIFLLLFVSIFSNTATAQNSINGLIFDKDRNPVANIDVELLDEYERYLRSVKTTSAGIYIFQGIRAGTYYVQVRVDGTNFKSAKERIRIGQTNFTNSTTGGISGGESLQLNFVLEIDRRRTTAGQPLKNEVIFAQDVPKEAEQFYKKAVNDLAKNKSDKAVNNLESALRIFPEYFLALDKLGNLLILQNKFAAAEKVFTQAVGINPKSFSSKSGLGIALYKTGKKQEAAAITEEAIVLNPASAASYLFVGKIYRELGQFDKSEDNLKKAVEFGQEKLPDAHWELALLYYYNFGRYDDAADELEIYLREKPSVENKKQIRKLINSLREKAKQQN